MKWEIHGPYRNRYQIYEEGDTTYIYGLFDPRTNECRYVGKSDNPEGRYKYYFGNSCPHNISSWIAELKAVNTKPELRILEEVDGRFWQEAEQYWIWVLPKLGHRLVNVWVGGRNGGYRPELKNSSKIGPQNA